MKIHSVGAELFCTDTKTDMTKPIVVFRNFRKMPKRDHHKQLCPTQQTVQVSRPQLLFETVSSTANYLTRRTTEYNL